MSEHQSSSLRYHREGTIYFSGNDQHERDSLITTYASDGHLVKQQRPQGVMANRPTPVPELHGTPPSSVASDVCFYFARPRHA